MTTVPPELGALAPDAACFPLPRSAGLTRRVRPARASYGAKAASPKPASVSSLRFLKGHPFNFRANGQHRWSSATGNIRATRQPFPAGPRSTGANRSMTTACANAIEASGGITRSARRSSYRNTHRTSPTIGFGVEFRCLICHCLFTRGRSRLGLARFSFRTLRPCQEELELHRRARALPRRGRLGAQGR